MKNLKKTQVFTPQKIVDDMLNKIGYHGKNIINKKILEPSFGDGVFLLEIVKRFVNECKNNNFNDLKIKKLIENNIFGIEIDSTFYLMTIEKLNKYLLSINFKYKINWNFINGDALNLKNYKNQKFDFFIGNPPYLSNHLIEQPLREKYKKEFLFCSLGNYNLYYAFYELFWLLRSDIGKLCYISPNSFLHNSSAISMRKKMIEDRSLVEIMNFQDYKLFHNYSVYASIVLLDFSDKENTFIYSIFDKQKWKKQILNLNNKNSSLLNEYNLKSNEENKNIKTGHGLATLADKIFILNNKKDFNKIDKKTKNSLVNFNGTLIEKGALKGVIKVSTSKNSNLLDKRFIIFPYKKDHKEKRFVPYYEEEFKKHFPLAFNYLLNNKDELLKRNIEKKSEWFLFGRSQAINGVINKNKIALKNLVNGSLVYFKVPKNYFIYSGMFITYSKEEELIKIKKTLSSKKIYKYIRITGKDFSGNHKYLTATQLKQIIN